MKVARDWQPAQHSRPTAWETGVVAQDEICESVKIHVHDEHSGCDEVFSGYVSIGSCLYEAGSGSGDGRVGQGRVIATQPAFPPQHSTYACIHSACSEAAIASSSP